ncbi:hypothetical protein Hanom_Chr01g00086491 [Helianthus anomalus]
MKNKNCFYFFFFFSFLKKKARTFGFSSLLYKLVRVCIHIIYPCTNTISEPLLASDPIITNHTKMSEHDQIQYSIEIPDDKILDWIIGSDTGVDANANDTPQPSSSAAKIPRVPSMLSDQKHNYEECFAPQAVSIGPYHFGEPKLQAFEEFKTYCVRILFAGDQEAALISLYKKLGEEDLRSFYEQDSTTKYSDNVFLKMMRVHGVLQDVSMKYKNKEYNYNSNNFPTVNQLLDVGIRFKPCDPISLNHVRFSKGWFEFSAAVQLPPITLSGRSDKPVLLNLIAYETCLGKDAWFASYVCLLRSLIGSHEDVRVLKKAGVLQHHFGTDNEVVDFFKEIATDLAPRNSTYMELKDDIQSYYEGWSNTPISELRHEYRKSPWKFISLLGASIALFLTAVQTYFAVWSRK